MSSAVNYAENTSNDLGISKERQRRPKKENQVFGECSQDSELPYDMEMRRELLSSIDRVIQEINLRVQQLHELAEKYAFLTSVNRLDDKYECQVDTNHDESDKEEFLVERKRRQHFTFIAANGKVQSWNEGPFELLQFSQKTAIANFPRNCC